MSEDDKQARKARAESIRKQIDQLKEGEVDDKGSSVIIGSTDGSETATEFIHRRMEELAKEKRQQEL
jgi:hypothetical protein